MFYKSSYERHNEWYNNHFPSAESKTNLYKRNREADKNNLSVWLQDIFFSCLNPLLKNKSNTWLTVGDAYGFDAQYILKSGNEALATDLNTDFLTIAEKEGIISSCSAQNAEKITFADESFDYVLCKESYHHFPRPYMAVYEMLRVARSGIIIMEPQDPVSKMPLLQFLHNLFASNKRIMSKIWKNRFSYEPVGNFVYKVSEREFEKIAAGLGLRLVAFKKINPNFWFKGAEYISQKNNAKLFKLTKCKKAFRDFLVRLRIIPAQTLVSVIFKTVPDEVTIGNLKQEGYRLVYIPNNPYIS